MIDAACHAYRRALLIGEPDGAHVATCESCALFRDDQRETAELVRHHRAKWAAPVALRERVLAAIEAKRVRSSPVWSGWPAWHWRTVVAAAAIAITIAVVAGWSLWPRERTVPAADELADRLVSDYLEYAHRDDKAQFASTSATELEAWYAREVGVAATVPRLRGARLVGGRHCKLDGRSAALTFFELPGRDDRPATPLSLFVFEPHDEDWSHMEQVASLPGKRKACRHERRGVALVVWQERGLDYALAGAVDSEELVELVR